MNDTIYCTEVYSHTATTSLKYFNKNQTYFTQGLLSHRMWVADEPGFDRTLPLVFFELLTVVHSPFVSFQFHNVWNATTGVLWKTVAFYVQV